MQKIIDMYKQAKKLIEDWKTERENSDKLWHEHKEEYGWRLPKKSFFIFRWPAVRYFRFLFHSFRLERWVRMHGAFCANAYDEWIIWAIYRGWY